MSLFEEAQLLASSSQSSKERLQAAQNCGPGLVWAEQKSGVHLTHTVQASTLASIAVGPSFRFRSPPVTWQAERERSIAVIPQTHADQIWSWSTDQTERDGSFAAEPPRKVFKVCSHVILTYQIDTHKFYSATPSSSPYAP